MTLVVIFLIQELHLQFKERNDSMPFVTPQILPPFAPSPSAFWSLLTILQTQAKKESWLLIGSD